MIFLKRNIIPLFLCLKAFDEILLILKLNPKSYLMVHKPIKNIVPASLSNFSSVTHLYSCPMFQAYLTLATPPNVPCFTSHSLYIQFTLLRIVLSRFFFPPDSYKLFKIQFRHFLLQEIFPNSPVCFRQILLLLLL